MDKFFGVSNIELEMLNDEIKKVLPIMLAHVEPISKLTIASYIALKKENDLKKAELETSELLQAAVNISYKKFRGE